MEADWCFFGNEKQPDKPLPQTILLVQESVFHRHLVSANNDAIQDSKIVCRQTAKPKDLAGRSNHQEAPKVLRNLTYPTGQEATKDPISSC